MRILCSTILTTLVLLQGCCIQQRVDYSEVPSWIYKIPVSKSNYYVVGAAGRGLNMEETLKKARENAFYNLSQALSFKIFSQSTEAQQNNINYVRNVQKVYSKTMIKEARQVDMWIDKNEITGQFQVYVLMELPKSSYKK